jgi:alkylhydroperoxidase family enzyme
VALGRGAGLTDEEIAAMAAPDSCASFDDRDKLVLRYSEVLTRDNKVSEALYTELADAFTRDELVELAITIGMSAMVNRVHATFDTAVDQETLDAVADGPVCPIGR